jgi:DNA-binding SARP family transcriptional activator/DNA-binding HxlR family transcriptional regulator
MIHFERWSLLILGEALLRDVSVAADFERNLLIDRATLTSRLEELVNSGLMDRRAASASSGEEAFELTDKGRDLERVIRELDDWSERWSLPVPTSADISLATDNNAAGTDQGRAETEVVPIEVNVLGSFRLRVGDQVIGGLPLGSQRLLVFLALHDRPVSRVAVAGKMWPDASHERAGISLRSALARLDPATRDAITVASAGLAIADTVTVDLHAAQDLAHRLLLGHETVTEADLAAAAVERLSMELLPDWHDEWILADSEDWRQLRTVALEEMAQILTDRDRPLEGAAAARAAIKVEPLRESAHVALIRAHLAHGNRSEAIGAYERYRELLLDVLNIEPTEQLAEMVGFRNT